CSAASRTILCFVCAQTAHPKHKMRSVAAHAGDLALPPGNSLASAYKILNFAVAPHHGLLKLSHSSAIVIEENANF
ncbi:MAG: hypothetical protein ACOX8U_09550, partial [Bradymonadia bacterium]